MGNAIQHFDNAKLLVYQSFQSLSVLFVSLPERIYLSVSFGSFDTTGAIGIPIPKSSNIDD
eukprot:UN04575